MRALKLATTVLLLVFAITAVAAAGPGKPPAAGRPAKVKAYAQGQVFCPTSALVVGNIVIQPGRCYVVYVLRDVRGTFLAFAPPGAFIPPGQLVRLNTPAGAKLKGRIFYLVPVSTTATVIPMNSVTLVTFRTEDFGPRLTITLTSPSMPNLSVTFQVKL